MNRLILILTFNLGIFIQDGLAKESLLEPPWKHCIHPLHAMPNSWGEVMSPGFPNGMTTQLQCSWIVDVNPGWRVKVAFHTLNMTGDIKNCYTQFVDLLDIKIGHSVGKFCGTRKPGDYVSHGTKMRIDLQGDTTGQPTKGFKIKYRATKEPAGFKTKFSFPDKPVGGRVELSGDNKGAKKPTKPKFNGGGKVDLNRIRGLRDGTITVKPKIKKVKSNATKSSPSNNPKASLAPKVTQPGVKRKPKTTTKDASKLFRPGPTRPPPLTPHQNIYGFKPVAGAYNPNEKPVVVVMHGDDKEEPEINLYLIIGLAVGAVVIVIIFFIIIKKCFCDKRKKRKDLDVNRNNMEKGQPPKYGEEISMSKSVPEKFMMEEIMQHSDPMMKRNVSSKRRPFSVSEPRLDVPQPLHAAKSFTLPRQHFTNDWERTKSLRSRRSRRERTRSTSSFRRSGSTHARSMGKETSRMERTRSTRRNRHTPRQISQVGKVAGHYFDFEQGKWIWTNIPLQPASISRIQTVPTQMNYYQQDKKSSRGKTYDDTESSSSFYSDSSYSSSEESSDVSRRRNKHNVGSRLASRQPPPYSRTMSRSYAPSTFDDGYHTGKRRANKNDKKRYSVSTSKSSHKKSKKGKKRRTKNGNKRAK